MDENKGTIDRLVKLQLGSLLAHLSTGHHNMSDRLAAAQATSALAMTSRLQAGEPIDVSVVREGVSVDDMFAQLDEDA
jgi:hypothetical protein